MTPQIALVLSILAVSVVLLVTEKIPMEVVALLVLGAVALTGLVQPADALSGFSNPAVVTIWAVFILSGGLTRTGVANVIGRQVLRLSGRSEMLLVTVIMVTAGVLSAFMNNVAVAALMLPVVMDIARQTGHSPSRLLMPLSYGSLLGGLTTLIGTPPNLLASNALRDNGLAPFTLFDFTPVGGLVMAAGVAFMALVGRRFLPERSVAEESHAGTPSDLKKQYDLHQSISLLHIASGSILVGKTIAESRLGSVLSLNVIGITRKGRSLMAPGPGEVLQAGDHLVVEGRLDRIEALKNELKNWSQLSVEAGLEGLEQLFSHGFEIAEMDLPADSPFVGKTLNETGFRNRFGTNVLAIRRDKGIRRTHLQDEPLRAGDQLLIQGAAQRLEALKDVPGFSGYRSASRAHLQEIYRLHERLLILQVPASSILVNRTLRQSRLGDAIGIRVLCIERENGKRLVPEPEEKLLPGDRLVVEGKLEDLFVLRGLEELEIKQQTLPDAWALETETVGMMEAVLSPHTTLAGKTLRQLHFREKYGLSVLAIWREGQAYRSANLRDMALRFGDALLLYGPRQKLTVLGREPDFLVLTQGAQELPRSEKAGLSTLIMAGALLPVLLGWVPIYIATVVGAAIMVLSRCLTMDEAYRFIEWKAVFLIAGMLPLGTALNDTGAARFLAEGVVAFVGPYGPMAVMLGLMLLTFFATCFIPTAALVVIMAPIVMSTSAGLGVSPQSLMMAIAMAASASFTSPISHPANVLVMGPGGYRFIDYIKAGVPLTVVVLLVVLVSVPFFWPIYP